MSILSESSAPNFQAAGSTQQKPRPITPVKFGITADTRSANMVFSDFANIGMGTTLAGSAMVVTLWDGVKALSKWGYQKYS